jgi:uncharacterized protein YegP (UPF0339 family)
LAGIFEIAEAGEKAYFFKLTAPDGTVVAVSPLFNSIKGAAAGITAVRENAATGLIVDKSHSRKRPASGNHPGRSVRKQPSSRVAPI